NDQDNPDHNVLPPRAWTMWTFLPSLARGGARAWSQRSYLSGLLCFFFHACLTALSHRHVSRRQFANVAGRITTSAGFGGCRGYRIIHSRYFGRFYLRDTCDWYMRRFEPGNVFPFIILTCNLIFRHASFIRKRPLR